MSCLIFQLMLIDENMKEVISGLTSVIDGTLDTHV